MRSCDLRSFSATEKSPMTMNRNEKPCDTARRVYQHGARPLLGHRARGEEYDRASSRWFARPGSKVHIWQDQIKKSTSISEMNLLRCQRPIFISTFNVRILNGKARQGEITAMFEKYRIDVTCVQEHRIHHPEETANHQDLGNGCIKLSQVQQRQ